MFELTTCDPRFSPQEPLKVNGYEFVPAPEGTLEITSLGDAEPRFATIGNAPLIQTCAVCGTVAPGYFAPSCFRPECPHRDLEPEVRPQAIGSAEPVTARETKRIWIDPNAPVDADDLRERLATVLAEPRPPRHYGLIARMRCVLFHSLHKDWWPGHHSQIFHCRRCGFSGEIDD